MLGLILDVNKLGDVNKFGDVNKLGDVNNSDVPVEVILISGSESVYELESLTWTSEKDPFQSKIPAPCSEICVGVFGQRPTHYSIDT